MAKLFHPQWSRNNGEIGGPVYTDWFTELRQFGSKGVLRGIEAVKFSGGSYAPNLNKFVGLCLEGAATGARPGDSYSEQLHGGQLKPAPNGTPLSWTVGNYTRAELMASGHPEDIAVAQGMPG